jgi:DNA-binding CsgD family transcriptional regulator
MDCIEAAVDSFREAAILPERWPGALDTLAQALRADGATLVLKPTRLNSVAFSKGLESFGQEYLLQYVSAGVQDPREARVDPGLREGFLTDYDCFTPREIARDPYYQEFLAPRGLGWHAAAALSEDLVVSLKRTVKRGHYDRKDLLLLNTTLPSLRAASRVASISWRSGLKAQLRVFERLHHGAILLDAKARVLLTNTCVEFGDGLDVSGGFLQAPRPSDRLRLQRFIAAVINVGSGLLSPRAATLALPRPSGLRPWLLDGIACDEAMRSLHSDAAALLLITNVERPLRPPPEVLYQLFGLTPMESKLACALLAGESLQQAAGRLAISEGHARQRLKTIFAKTATSRQGELTALLSKLG